MTPPDQSLHKALADTGLFTEASGRRLIHEQAVANSEVGHMVARTVLRFDPFGDLVAVESKVVDAGLRAIVAQNREAMGLPPQENP